MPNKRKKGKKLVAGWLTEKDAAAFKACADALGIPVSDLLTQLIREEISRNGTNNNDKEENNA